MSSREMTFGEALTKAAIMLGFLTYWHLGFFHWAFGWWGTIGAAALCVIALMASFIRDSHMQGGRPVMTYGSMFVLAWIPTLIWICYIVPYLLRTDYTVRGEDGPIKIGFWAATAMAFFGATIVKAITLFAEGVVAAAWPTAAAATNVLLADLRGEVYAPPNPQTGEPEYRGFIPPNHWQYQCPACNSRVQHQWGTCWRCNYSTGMPPDNTMPVQIR